MYIYAFRASLFHLCLNETHWWQNTAQYCLLKQWKCIDTTMLQECYSFNAKSIMHFAWPFFVACPLLLYCFSISSKAHKTANDYSSSRRNSSCNCLQEYPKLFYKLSSEIVLRRKKTAFTAVISSLRFRRETTFRQEARRGNAITVERACPKAFNAN